jgi:uncharacterized membrane protein
LAASEVAHDQLGGEPPREPAPAEPTLRIGLVAAPGLPSSQTAGIADQLRADLEAAFPSVRWAPEVLTEQALVIPPAGVAELVEAMRQELLDHEWAICVGVTDLPLYVDGRPIASHVSVTHGVGIVSLPALGALQLPRRLRDEIVEVIAELVCEESGRNLAGTDDGGMSECGARAQRVLEEMALHDGPNQPLTPLFVIRVAARHVRLLLGMLRANRPWRLAAHLHRSLFGAFAVSAYVLVTPDVWRIADSLEPLRLVLLTAAATIGTVISLIAGHRLWERVGSPESQPQVVLFNLATTLTVAGGVLVLYIAQFAGLLAAALVLLKPDVLARALGHAAHIADYVKLVWLAASLATTGGALGAALESDNAVREAAYAYRARHARGSAP